MSAIVSLAAVMVDCRQAAPLAAFYESAFGGEIFRTDKAPVFRRCRYSVAAAEARR